MVDAFLCSLTSLRHLYCDYLDLLVPGKMCDTVKCQPISFVHNSLSLSLMCCLVNKTISILFIDPSGEYGMNISRRFLANHFVLYHINILMSLPLWCRLKATLIRRPYENDIESNHYKQFQDCSIGQCRHCSIRLEA